MPKPFTDNFKVTKNGTGLDDIVELLDLKTQVGRDSLRIALANIQLMDRKQQDYGPRNISTFGINGVVIRMSDKMERMKNLYSKKRRSSKNEPFIDSLQDISNYGIIGQMLELDLWPKA